MVGTLQYDNTMSTASESFPSTEKRQRLRRGGSQCSHTTRLDVPLLELGSNMSLQLAHERNGLLLSHAHSSNCTDRTRIMRALQQSDVDLSKAQACGHCHQLTARLAESLLHHLLFAKGQLPEPVSLLRKRREVAFFATSTSSRHRLRNNSARTRKEDKVLRKLDQFRLHLEEAAKHLSALADNNGEGPSRRPYPSLSPSISSHDVRLLVVMGPVLRCRARYSCLTFCRLLDDAPLQKMLLIICLAPTTFSMMKKSRISI